MSKLVRLWISVMVILGTVTITPMVMAAQPAAAPVAIETTAPLAASSLAPSDVVTVTVLHTNDFHGNLELAGSNPGAARMAKVINDVRAAVGPENVALFDAGDIMQSTLLSNLFHGESTMDVFNLIGYDVATVGNHEFDWGQPTLISRTEQAEFPFVAANLTVKAGDSCASWDTPTWVRPWYTMTVGTGANQVVIGVIGITCLESPYITIASATEGLCFKDPTESILHYYDEVDAASDVIIALTHIGNTDGGYGYGITVYGDQTLAKNLAAAGKPVDLIIGGHSHTNLAAAQVIDGITVVQAYYAGRRVGRADIGVDKTTGDVNVAWQPLVVSTSGDEDPAVKALVEEWASDPWYQSEINREVGFSNVDLVRNYDGDSLMGKFVNDAIYNDLNLDDDPLNDADMVFNNPGGLRADLTSITHPFTLTHGMLYSVLPFGNATAIGDMTGAQILDLLNQSATLFKGSIQVAGIRFSFYRYADALPGPQPYAWGAYDITVKNRDTEAWESLVMTKTYRVATNEFLAPAGQDGFIPFKYMTNISYWGDMLDGVERWVSTAYSTTASAYNEALDGRITRNGDDDGGTIFPVTILHHNDSHGNLAKGTYVGYTQLATLIKQERQHNPYRTILLNGGDQIQGDAMMYYFKTAPLGYAADGTSLPITMTTHPMMAVMNAMDYDAMVVGNHEYNFGNTIFTNVLGQANFPMLQANVYDTGVYGLDAVPIEPDVEFTVENVHQTGTGTILLGDPIKIAVLGIGNHRIPNYELPSNIPGLTFTSPITETQARVPALRAANDVVVALTHIGFTEDPKSVEVDENVDTNLAMQTSGLDAIIGAHSHTNPATGFGDYKYLPAIVANSENAPVIINQAYRYNNTLGEVIIGLRLTGGGYEVVSRAGRYISVAYSTPEDPEIKAIVDPYAAFLAQYNATILGQTLYPIDTLPAYTEETNGANLQADSSVWELAQHGVNADFHLSGAMTNKLIATTATPTTPYTLTVADMFAAMPYENSLVALQMNGPQLKAVLERGYRNYYYYKYVPGYGGYSHYTTCMLDINAGGQITYRDMYPALPSGNNVISLTFDDQTIDFMDATTYYTVSTVNYLAAGSCNFNNGGVSLWPLGQIVADTQNYVRDAVINYVTDQGVISPTIEGRLVFLPPYKVFLPVVMRNSN